MLFIICILLSSVGFILPEDISAHYRCDFEDDDCGFFNVLDYHLLWRHEKMSLGGREGNAFILYRGTRTSSQTTGELMTPEFQLDIEMLGCVTVDLYVDGNVEFEFIQGKGENAVTLYKLSRPNESYNPRTWQRIMINLELDPITQFFFKGTINDDDSIIAIDNFVFELNKC